MSIKDELNDELKDAMRSHDRNRIDAIRQINAEVGRAVKAPGFSAEVDDEFYRRTIASYVKKMSKALAEYEGYGDRGADAAAKLRFEVEYLGRWLPRVPSEDELTRIVDAVVREAGTTDMPSAGQIIGRVMKQHPGLDGATVSRLVRARLEPNDRK